MAKLPIVTNSLHNPRGSNFKRLHSQESAFSNWFEDAAAFEELQNVYTPLRGGMIRLPEEKIPRSTVRAERMQVSFLQRG